MILKRPRQNSSQKHSRFPLWNTWKWCGLFICFCACSTAPKGSFDQAIAPTPPNYGLAETWAALPTTKDPADQTPGEEYLDKQKDAEVDVFFLHPTSYTGSQRSDQGWNGPIYLESLQKRTDEASIRYQASLFNGAGRVYAPRYRQAHLRAYYSKDQKESAQQALDLAYGDVKAGFEYYLTHYNEGRPIIIAAHSQGTTHAKRLVSDYFDGEVLQDQLVVAYLVGMEVEMDAFDFIKACGGPEEIGCFCSWRTWRKGRYPDYHIPGNEIAVTNPLHWTTTNTYAPASLNKGAVLKDFYKIRPEVTDAQVHDGLLWASKPRFPWSFLLFNPNYHIGDYNLYYLNVRQNAIQRANSFLKLQKGITEKTSD